MYIYNENIHLFLDRIRAISKNILINEMGFARFNKRIHYEGHTYPVNFVVFENPKLLGYFEWETFTIAINKNLLYVAKEKILKNIIRHELAHLVLFIKEGIKVQAHGVEYRNLCKSFLYSEEVYGAKLNLSLANDQIEGDLASEKIINKIKKLLSLATSENPFEAQNATRKANQLLLKHNLDSLDYLTKSTNEIQYDLYTKRVYKCKRSNAKLHCISKILKCFYVYPVVNHTQDGVYLEVTGKKTNVELASYLSDFLQKELERLWHFSSSKDPSLKGLRAKNSFFTGIANGYCDKMKDDQKQNGKATLKALSRFNDQLENYAQMAIPGLRATSKNQRLDPLALSSGFSAGKNLNINKGISSKNNQSSKKLLGFI